MSQVKEDGINISDWLQSLSTFVATACRKHGAEMEISAICQLLSNALKRGESFDLLVLKVRQAERERELATIHDIFHTFDDIVHTFASLSLHLVGASWHVDRY